MSTEKSSFENSRLEKLQKALYSRNADMQPKDERTVIHDKNVEAPTSWGAPKTFGMTVDPVVMRRNNSFFNKFLLISATLFFISLAVALYIFYGGINMISSNNLDVRIVAPSSVSSGEELPIGLTIINGNSTDLQDVVMYVDYPEGAQAINSEKALTHDKINLGTIAKGASTEYSLRSTLFGEKDVTKEYNFRIEYKVKGSNATFSKEKTYSVSVGSAPVLMNVDYPKEVNSGQEVTLSIDLTSNSAVVLKNTIVRIDYPYGFTYKTSNIKPSKNNFIWNIGDLKNGDKKTLEVTGVILGQNQEDKTFKITTGTQSQDPAKDFDTSLAEQDATMGIRKSFFDLVVTGENKGSVRLGDSTSINIKWHNTLPEKILNTKIVATVSGNVLDRAKVTPDSTGYYQSVNNSVLWDKNTTKELSQMLPGDGGAVSLGVGSSLDQSTSKIKNPHLDVHVVVTGDRSGPDGGSVSSEANYQVKIISNLNFTAKSYRTTGPFTNTGPIPPRADKETTYTITWTFTNTSNDLSGVVAKATLPKGVSWKGEVSPGTEKISYDADSSTVTWNAGNIASGAGFSNSARTVSFKIGFVPSVSEIQNMPDIVSKVDISARDTYVDALINFTSQVVTTFAADVGFKSLDATVIK